MEHEGIHEILKPEIESSLIKIIKENEEDGLPSKKLIAIKEDSDIFEELKRLVDNREAKDQGHSYKLNGMGYCLIEKGYPGEIDVFYFEKDDGELKK